MYGVYADYGDLHEFYTRRMPRASRKSHVDPVIATQCHGINLVPITYLGLRGDYLQCCCCCLMYGVYRSGADYGNDGESTWAN